MPVDLKTRNQKIKLFGPERPPVYHTDLSGGQQPAARQINSLASLRKMDGSPQPESPYGPYKQVTEKHMPDGTVRLAGTAVNLNGSRPYQEDQWKWHSKGRSSAEVTPEKTAVSATPEASRGRLRARVGERLRGVVDKLSAPRRVGGIAVAATVVVLAAAAVGASHFGGEGDHGRIASVTAEQPPTAPEPPGLEGFDPNSVPGWEPPEEREAVMQSAQAGAATPPSSPEQKIW